MGAWTRLDPKVAVGLVVFVVITIFGPFLASLGIDLTGAKATALALLGAYLTPNK